MLARFICLSTYLASPTAPCAQMLSSSECRFFPLPDGLTSGRPEY